ncbi:MAG: type III secretion system chaperone [Pseudomonadota bacterium]
MRLDEILTELAAASDVDAPNLDDDGGAQLVLDDETLISVEPMPKVDGFAFHAVVAPVPAGDRGIVFAELLHANSLGLGTAGASLALNPEMDDIVLSRVLYHSGMSVEQFEASFEAFTGALRYWRKRAEDGHLGQGDWHDEDDFSSPEIGNAETSVPPGQYFRG